MQHDVPRRVDRTCTMLSCQESWIIPVEGVLLPTAIACQDFRLDHLCWRDSPGSPGLNASLVSSSSILRWICSEP